MSCEELQLGVAALRCVIGRGYLQKRGGGMIKSWNHRYTVIAGNFLYTFMTDKDTKPRKIVGLDGCEVNAVPTKFKGRPHAFQLKTRVGNELYFSGDTPEASKQWITAIQSAGYTYLRERVMLVEDKLAQLRGVLSGTGLESKADDPAPDVREGLVREPVDLNQLIALAQTRLRGAAEAEGRIARLESQLRASEHAGPSGESATSTEVDRVRADLRDAEDSKAALQDQVRFMQDEIDRLREDLRAARTKSPVHPSPHRRDTSETKMELQAARETLQHKDDEITELNRRLRDAVNASAKESARLQDQISTLEARLRRAEMLDHAAAASRPPATTVVPTVVEPRRLPPESSAKHASSRDSTASGSPVKEGADPYEHEWAPFYKEAQALEQAGRLADAQQQYQSVLELRRERSGDRSVAVATASRDLGRVLALQRQFDRAELHYIEAVGLCKDLLGEAHPNTACALTDLAAVQREQGKFEEAEAHAAQAVTSLRRGVGAKDVSTATALYNLAGLAKRQHKYRAAEASYAEALEIFQEKLGDGEGETADTMYQMGCLYRKRNDYRKAGDMFRQAADAYGKAYGPSDRRVDEAAKRARAMSDKLAGVGSSGAGSRSSGGHAPATGGRVGGSGSRLAARSRQ